MKKLIQIVVILLTILGLTASMIKLLSWKSEAAYVWELINEKFSTNGGPLCPDTYTHPEEGILYLAKMGNINGETMCEYTDIPKSFASAMYPFSIRLEELTRSLPNPLPGQTIHWAVFVSNGLIPVKVEPYESVFPLSPTSKAMFRFRQPGSSSFRSFTQCDLESCTFLAIQLRDGTLVRVFGLRE